MSAAEPVDWGADGTPHSARSGDIYHTSSGALEQARHVFLGGCRLPQAWAGRPHWTILETGFGLGTNFLAAWLAWKNDESRARILHFVSVEAYPVAADDLRRAASAYPELLDLADALAAQWHGLLPGVHRLAFESGHVLLTLCIGDAQAQLRTLAHFDADSVFLDDFSPADNPDMWSPTRLKAVARFAKRGTRVSTWSTARPLRDALTSLGFSSATAPGLAPKRDRLEALFNPTWTPRRPPASPDIVDRRGHCMIIGAGLAGAAVAASLVRRGWRVTVLEAAAQAAAGASGLPVGLMAPHFSPDDALMSRLSRAGIRATWQQLVDLLQAGVDWSPTGALERRDTPARMPTGWQSDGPNESWTADAQHLQDAGLPVDAPAVWHARAAWVRPARLVQAWLERSGVSLLTRAHVAALSRQDDGRVEPWHALDDAGGVLAQADRIVIACGVDSRLLAPNLPLNIVRGQVLMGASPVRYSSPSADGQETRTASRPVNGNGHLIPNVPDGDGSFWLAGSTYERGDPSRELRDAGDLANLDRLAQLHPVAAEQARAAHRQGQLRAWAGLRCVSRDRRPLVGPASPLDPDGPWICTALGSRGLSFATLCAELLAARWHGEPLPLQSALAEALDTRRMG